MGAWGTSLYENDTACDIRGDYIDKLKRGKSGEKATNELISQNSEIMEDREEAPLFWYALADTQWEYGRLLPEIKEKALFFIEQKEELERWKESGEEKCRAWQKTLAALKEKLNTPAPKAKEVSGYRLYRCPWKLGDVFAYQFSGDHSKEKGFYHQYVIFRKISEDTYWPGHIVPVVQIYDWVGAELPSLDEIKEKELLVQNCLPETLRRQPDIKREYAIKLITTSRKMLPEVNLTFLGNVGGDDLLEFRGHDYLSGYIGVGWDGSRYNRWFEKYIIDRYLAWHNV